MQNMRFEALERAFCDLAPVGIGVLKVFLLICVVAAVRGHLCVCSCGSVLSELSNVRN